MTLTFNIPEQMFQMALLLVKVNNCAKLFRNPCINVQVMARKNLDGRTMHARTSHAQATHNACTYTDRKLYQLCLAPCKLARHKCNGIKTAKEDFKENPSIKHPIILSIDTCRRFFFLILYNIIGLMLFCCHSNQWLMLQMIIYSDIDVRVTFRHKNILYCHSSSS